MQQPIAGYIRADVTHRGCEWSFEILSEQPKVGIVSIATADGSLHVALNRADAENVLQKLQLFLAEWPDDRAM